VELPVESAAAKVSPVELLMGLAGSEGFTGYTAAQVGSDCVPHRVSGLADNVAGGVCPWLSCAMCGCLPVVTRLHLVT